MIKALPTIAALLTALATPSAFAQQAHHPASPYAGEQTRAIKSLSDDDIAELSRGGGWGLARAAELNGVPGPAHLLELKREIGLSPEQEQAAQRLFDQMKSSAVPLGKKLIELERELDRYFQSGKLSDATLRELLERIGATRTELRYVHLVAHHRTVEFLKPEQIARYNALRGYSAPGEPKAANPCDNVPAGHDPQMYRRHMGCN
jgi:Spy/CpxP family protein refolding chaperone